ncbi:MAG: hypothetical protein AAGI45_18475 [Cyanobacteria bacterium P01_H01_bin.26]
MVTLFISGAVVGSLQWIVLRWTGKRGLPWIIWPIASGLGWILSTLLSIMTLSTMIIAGSSMTQFGLWDAFWVNLLLRPIEISCMAAAQGVILGYSTRSKARILGIWILASCLGGALHGAVSALLCDAFCAVLPSALMGIIHSMGWAVYGILTGIILVRILSVTGGEPSAPDVETVPLEE